ncbi:hypothetical protein BBK36DRAFT_1185661 [Trichoderma citrinoviride]|uniref:DUF4419 domain-containing protein n=1 Tax=Trichoderma citrinoviride TaxID=58853 RepID=A0A2T4AYJ4_9HYPO|nr:hypothetical protein BBK36DRAFT_1185661 [Trichoderma citrinoviride]PTB62137.1 hypothetical protein BBK36DRAFT_1185661 [Trichoderma citrinoviride]
MTSTRVVTRPKPDIVGSNNDAAVTSSANLLKEASRETDKPKGPEARKVLHHSFGDIDRKKALNVVPYANGFVHGIIRAFQQDLHLVLRPDDIWLAITVQFSFYVNGHAEELRSHFVNHEGKKKLVVDMSPQSMATLDVASAAEKFTTLIQSNVLDPELRSWILPDFTTTTDNDISVGALVMMATTKAYFEYIILMGCGFPSVTLEGERDDWVKLLERLPKLATFGEEPAHWSKLLTKVVEKMVETFDRPDDEDVKDFWMRAVHEAGEEGSGRGLISLSGWITAFCFWDEKGRMIHQYTDKELADHSFEQTEDRKRQVIDDVVFPVIGVKSVPRAVVEVPVKVLDGNTMLDYDTTIIVGSVGVTATASERHGEIDTFQPRSGWWMLQDKVQPLNGEDMSKHVEDVCKDCRAHDSY